ncbi:glycosyltransferase [Paraburkholderia oxyphila]|uniref:glycosyltransferase n=1 Tax=Paraburkholderia oxyphila TaxID=614212 RepID=UPI0014288B38|nr:glycosyltransferase [Paraburkholderia oxyphila]
MQFGHALKEAGFLSRVEAYYYGASDNADGDLEYRLQMAHLAKVRGRFAEAADYYTKALGIARANGDLVQTSQIKQFLEPVRRVLDCNPTHHQGVDYYVSSAASGLLASLAAPASEQLGKANYSYAFAANGFVEAFENLGYYVSPVAHPEYFPVPKSNDGKRVRHISFAPPHLARVIKGGYNIIHFAWEFARIPSQAENVSAHPFQDWLRMLNAFDEIWLPSRFAVSVVAPLVSKPVRYVPSPVALPKRQPARDREGYALALARPLESLRWVPLSIFPRLQANFAAHAMARARSTMDLVRRVGSGRVSRIFLTILNPHDRRKQLKPLLQAFCGLAERDRDAILLIKTSSPDDTNETINQRLLSHQIADETELVPPYVSNQIWIYNGALTSAQLSALYGIASFYVCTSSAEGQNLPLLEAMAHGCVPLSVTHTAMADYITSDNAITIDSELAESPANMRQEYGMFDNFRINHVTAQAVGDALDVAFKLDREAYLRLSRNAIETVRAEYGEEALRGRIAAEKEMEYAP